MTTTRRILLLIAATAATALYGADAPASWGEHCAKCHGDDGKGDTKMGHKLNIGDFTSSEMQAKFTDEQAAKAIKVGLTDDKGKMRMKAIEGLSDDQVKALVTFVRTLKK